jgi:hypothetical protein
MAESVMDDSTLCNRVTTRYLGAQRVRIEAGANSSAASRAFEADQRTHLDREGAGFCPLELVAAALGA